MKKVILENHDIQLEILPSCGGKIHSLTSKASGKQWLWHNPHIPLEEPIYGDSYAKKLDTGGWDEIFPSVLPCRVPLSNNQEMIIPDHGDIVMLPASVDRPNSNTLVTTTTGRCANYEFVRQISLYDHQIELRYQIVNHGDIAFPFMWCAHPLLAIEPTMTIDLDCSVPFTVEAAFGDAPFQTGQRFRWAGTRHSKKIPTPETPGFSPYSMKLFSDADTLESVSVLSPKHQEKLVFSWDHQFARHCGIWINYGAWPVNGSKGTYCLGIEPSTSPCDGLCSALQSQSAWNINPGETKEWFVEVEILPYHIQQYSSPNRQIQRLAK